MINKSCDIGQATIEFETGKLAIQAPGSIVVRSGETTVLVTAVSNNDIREGIDFFPLTVDVEERMYSAGKIPGGFFRREGRQTEKAILACRLIDRPLRPSFSEGFRCETQIIATVLSVDNQNDYDVLALNAASLALKIAGVPLESLVGAVRMSLIGSQWHPQSTADEMEKSVFDMVVAGKVNDRGEVDIVMVEAGATESAMELIDEGSTVPDEKVVADGINEAKEHISKLIDLQKSFVDECDVPAIEWVLVHDYTQKEKDDISEKFLEEVKEAISEVDKVVRKENQNRLEEIVIDEFVEEDESNLKSIKSAYNALVKETIRSRVVNDQVRLDGRGSEDIREIKSEINILPKVHGSSLFQRGETQVLNVTTLGMSRLEQMLDTIDTVTSKRYMHHYNFPPYSTGEAYPMRGPKRREIGHGALAERALLAVIPSKSEFPYTIRLVSEAIASNGSTSQASVCASSLSLMSAGVPISEHVAGIAMGLIAEEGSYVTLTDILGSEDAIGDMDFKVAGTKNMITALQLDMKIEGLPSEILAKALDQAKDARLKILEVMNNTVSEPAQDVNENAPRLETIELPKDKIGEVIGPKGKNIRKIEEDTGVTVEIDDDGVLTLGSTGDGNMEEAKIIIDNIINPPEVEVGVDYEGEVVSITSYGAFVSIFPGRDGLLHVSKFHSTKRVSDPEKVLDIGQKLEVYVDSIERGKISLSLKEDLDVPSDAEGKSQGQGKGKKSHNTDNDKPSRNRKQVSFEDDYKKGL